jgi:hypothetical protein
MSALDQTEKSGLATGKSASDIVSPACQVNKRLRQSNKLHPYSITSSARASSVGGTVRPSAFEVVRLIDNSNLEA